ncbi:hypothetical protein C1I99_02615 [Micromonospora deserti]|uniref:Uncharacterized protein n=1 Tax=Micromonospora deserti TaxID=2070366 RepID=A0A2W2DEM8_9ACTN|nr:hypothetical protein C1I99_02615 [Micromonospora deserti]
MPATDRTGAGLRGLHSSGFACAGAATATEAATPNATAIANAGLRPRTVTVPINAHPPGCLK